MDLEEGEIIDDLTVGKPEAVEEDLTVNKSLSFIPYLPIITSYAEEEETNNLILIQGPPYVADIPTDFHRSPSPSSKDDRIGGGFWAKMRTIRKSTERPIFTNSDTKEVVVLADLSKETNSLSSSIDESIDNVASDVQEVAVVKAEAVMIESEEDDDEEMEEIRARNRALSSLLKQSTNEENVVDDEDEMLEMQLRLKALESTLQRTQTQAADLLERGQKELEQSSEPRVSPIDLEEGELEPEEWDEGDLDVRPVESVSKDIDLRSISVATSNTSCSFNTTEQSNEGRMSQLSALTPVSMYSNRSRTRNRNRRGRRRRKPGSSEKRRQSHQNSSEIVEKKQMALNNWQQKQREKILNLSDPDQQLHEFFKMVTTTSVDLTNSTDIITNDTSGFDSDSTPAEVSIRAHHSKSKLVDNYDVCSMELGSESGDVPYMSPDIPHFDIPLPPGVSPPAIDAIQIIEDSTPVPDSRPSSGEQSKESEDKEEDDDETSALRAVLLASLKQKRDTQIDNTPEVDENEVIVDEREESTCRTVIDSHKSGDPKPQELFPRPLMSVVNDPYKLVVNNTQPIQRVNSKQRKGRNRNMRRRNLVDFDNTFRQNEVHKMQRDESQPHRYVHVSKHKLQVTTVRHEPLLIPIDDESSESEREEDVLIVSDTNDNKLLLSPDVNTMLDRCLKDARIKADHKKATIPPTSQPIPEVNNSPLKALTSRLDACQEDMSRHKKSISDDKVQIKNLDSIILKHQSDFMTAETKRKALLEQLSAVQRVCNSHKKSIDSLKSGRSTVILKLSNSEKLQNVYEIQWKEIQRLIARHQSPDVARVQPSTSASLQSRLVRKRKLSEPSNLVPDSKETKLEKPPSPPWPLPNQILRYENSKEINKFTDGSIFGHFDSDQSIIVSQPKQDGRDSPLTCFKSYRLSPHLRLLDDFRLSSLTFAHKIDPMVALCPFSLTGQCVDTTCPWQHENDYTMTPVENLADLISFYPKSLDFFGQKDYLELAQSLWDERGERNLEELLREVLTKIEEFGCEIDGLYEPRICKTNQNTIEKSVPETPVPSYNFLLNPRQKTNRYFIKQKKKNRTKIQKSVL